jgi:hypothetical protein
MMTMLIRFMTNNIIIITDASRNTARKVHVRGCQHDDRSDLARKKEPSTFVLAYEIKLV